MIEIGTKIKIIQAQEGAYGANNKTGYVCEKPLYEKIHGLGDRPNNHLYVRIINDRYFNGVWNIGRTAKFEVIE